MDHFTPAAKRAIAQAEAFARRHGEIERFPDPNLVLGIVTADHLLLGVAHPAAGADLWPRFGLQAAALHAALERALLGGVWPPAPTDAPPAAVRPDPAEVIWDEFARRALDYAAAEARRLRHPDIRPEHLLLGAPARAPPARESLGGLVLAEFGITLAAVFTVIPRRRRRPRHGPLRPPTFPFEP